MVLLRRIAIFWNDCNRNQIAQQARPRLNGRNHKRPRIWCLYAFYITLPRRACTLVEARRLGERAGEDQIQSVFSIRRSEWASVVKLHPVVQNEGKRHVIVRSLNV